VLWLLGAYLEYLKFSSSRFDGTEVRQI
jgi:hypothetical protein